MSTPNDTTVILRQEPDESTQTLAEKILEEIQWIKTQLQSNLSSPTPPDLTPLIDRLQTELQNLRLETTNKQASLQTSLDAMMSQLSTLGALQLTRLQSDSNSPNPDEPDVVVIPSTPPLDAPVVVDPQDPEEAPEPENVARSKRPRKL